jgi:hypothetical protein
LWPIQEARRFMFVPYAKPSALGYEAGYNSETLQLMGALAGLATHAA